jgi:DNA polymerase-3 subunit epsilon
MQNKPYYVFFDTETTGLPKKWKAPVTDLDNWPRLIQLAYIVYSEKGEKLEEGNHIIKPEGFIIPEGASNVHGITTDKAVEEGKDLTQILQQFYSIVSNCNVIVAHNIAFDEKVIGSEFLRNSFNNILNEKQKICTMISTVNFCSILGPYGFKWPGLAELYIKLFGKNFDNAHDAFADIEATANCFWELKRIGEI